MTGPRCGYTRTPERARSGPSLRFAQPRRGGSAPRAARPPRDAAGRGAAQRRPLDPVRHNSAMPRITPGFTFCQRIGHANTNAPPFGHMRQVAWRSALAQPHHSLAAMKTWTPAASPPIGGTCQRM
jgi:hypothetical protein